MHSFTKREKIVLLVLAVALVIGVYFIFIFYPVKTRLEEIDIEKINAEDETTISMAVLEKYRNMKDELEDILAMPEEELTYMPEYDNVETLTLYFNTVFAETAPNLSFSNPQINGNVASRTISFNFTADSYQSAKNILTLLTGSGFRCLMQNVSISPNEGKDVERDKLTISGNIVFYELVKQEKTASPDEEAAAAE